MPDTHSPLTQECVAIATHLNAQSEYTWTLEVKDPAHWHRLHGPQGTCINLHRLGNCPERLRIRGVLPRGPNQEYCLPYAVKEPEITVARARGAKAISRDIVRRFLPKYTQLLQQAQEKKAQLHARDEAQHALVGRLLAHGCVEAPTGGSEWLRVKRTSTASPEVAFDVWGRVQITGPQTVTLELRQAPEPLVHQILAALDQLTLSG
ncbi:MAG: hypothetical protein OEU26_24420 [Candidatus Tectomicrobia bacterium]|nr:hypothetical protein [Candidatus Tectomicrobia bacterium]